MIPLRYQIDTLIYHSQMNLLRIYPSKTALATRWVANQHKMGITTLGMKVSLLM